MPFVNFTRATLRNAEFGFFGVVVYTLVHTPLFCGLFFKLDGKKGAAERAVYGAFDIIAEKTGKDALEVYEEALKNVMPVFNKLPTIMCESLVGFCHFMCVFFLLHCTAHIVCGIH